MTEQTNGRFRCRAFVSVLAGFTFLAMAATGLVMFFAPSCRIARDMSWTVLGYGKDQWIAVHVWFSIAFVIASVFHLCLNWSVLTSYFKNKLRRGFALRTEWVAALVICAVIGLGTIYEVAPFSSLVAWKETFKRSEFSRAAGGQGWRGGRAGVQYGQNLPGSAATNAAARYGIGQKTLKQFCADEGIELSWALPRLQNKGFTAAEATTMREIADGAGIHPRELRSILQAQ